MGACVQSEQQKTIRVARPTQKAVIKESSVKIVSEPVVATASEKAQAEPAASTKVRVRVHPSHELEKNDNVEEPWTCMGD